MMAILLEEDYEYPLPNLIAVKQIFDDLEIKDVENSTKAELRKEEIVQKIHPGDTVAIAVGSRGIQNLKAVSYTHLDVYKRQVLQIVDGSIKSPGIFIIDKICRGLDISLRSFFDTEEFRNIMM